MSDLVQLLERLRADAENEAALLETGAFKVYSVALDGAHLDCTQARAKLFRDFAIELDRAVRIAVDGLFADIRRAKDDGTANEAS